MDTAPSATRRTDVREAQLNDDVLPGGGSDRLGRQGDDGMLIGTVEVDRRLRLSCPYGRGTLIIQLGSALAVVALAGAADSLAFYAAAAQPGAPQGVVRLLISILVFLVGPIGCLLITGWFLRHQLTGRAGTGTEGSEAGATAPPRPPHDVA